MLSDVKVKEL